MEKITVQVQSDHLEKLTKARPISGLQELIWNSLDADSSRVDIVFYENEIGGTREIEISDDGTGIDYEEAKSAFGKLGGSWKLLQSATKNEKRFLHGKGGKGRFKGFSLGDTLEWNTKYKKNGKTFEFSIIGKYDELGTFTLSEPKEAKGDSGTKVKIANLYKEFRSISGEQALQEVTEHFALYLHSYPTINIFYGNNKINPKDIEERIKTITLKPVFFDGKNINAELTIIEWKVPSERFLFLCDKGGFPLSKIQPGIQASGFNFSAYLKSNYIRELDEEGVLLLEEMHPGLQAVINPAKEEMRNYFRERAAESTVGLIETWKKEKIYPFEGEPKSMVETAERQVFDVCALTINDYLPSFEKTDNKNKKLSLSLIKQAIEKGPEELQLILQDVLELPKEKQVELGELLKKTTLTAIINAAKVVSDRLNFIRGLEVLIFEKDYKKNFKERTQLHRLLAENTWLFGEEFNLSIDDQSLTEVLNKHLKLLGREPTGEKLAGVTRDDGSIGIVDLMLSRLIKQPKAECREHLVIELKRPIQPIDDTVAHQIRSYAYAVADDERFRDTKTNWVFWAISNEITGAIRKQSTQRGREEGILDEDSD
jgi:hypothetical protein